MSEKETRDEIKVEDRRYFDREGNVVAAEDEKPETEVRGAQHGEHSETQRLSASDASAPDFIAILFTYVHSALIHLGDVEDPVEHQKREDLDMARHMIDILELLQQKTKGNLTDPEQQYLEHALFDLRVRFMQKKKIIK